jgi:hypothetical protein
MKTSAFTHPAVTWPSCRTAGLALLASLAASSALAAPDFHADIAPLLRDYCLGCHNEQDKEGDLSVETFADLMRGGESGPSIVPGKAAESFLVRTVTKEEKPTMPPKKEPQPSASEVALLQAWVNAGAPGPAKDKDVSLRSTLIVPAVPVAAKALQKQPVSATAVSPDGQLLAVARYGVVQIMDAASQKILRELADHPGKVNAVHFSANGQQLLSASGVAGLRGTAVLWEVASGKKLREFGTGSRDIFYDAEFSPDGSQIATAGYDRDVSLWETATGKLLHRIAVHNGAVFDLAFSPDGRVLASASADQTIKLWSTRSGERLDTLNQPQGEQYSVLFTPDGQHILAAGGDNRIRLWRLLSVEKPQLNPLLAARFAHEGEIVRLAITADGRHLISSSADLTLKSWTLPALENSGLIDQQPDIAAAIALSADGKTLVAGRMDGSLVSLPIPVTATVAVGAAAASGSSNTPATAAESSAPLAAHTESEPNDRPQQAEKVVLPARIKGLIGQPADADCFAFQAKAGQQWVFEIEAERVKSQLDSRIEILHSDGRPVEQVVLQAVRDSWFTFRGKDSNVSSDFRVHNWEEMDLNDYLYANGEVVKFWLYPRGPDSGFNVYPGTGNRHSYFGTTAQSHPLGEPCYIVKAMPPGSAPIANGLPSFTLYYENDDDSKRALGKDSKLIFTAPQDGEFIVRVRDVTQRGGADFPYTLTIRPRAEDFQIKIGGMNPVISPGSGKELSLVAERMDEFEGEITLAVSGLPPGFSLSAPLVIEKEQHEVYASLFAAADAAAPTAEQVAAIQFTATATVAGKKVSKALGGLGTLKLGPPAKVKLEIIADGSIGQPRQTPGQPLELILHPGETISAVVKATRNGFDGQVPLGKEDSGRNLPFGVYVDNIGLSGLLILEKEIQRKFFITAGPRWLPGTTRPFHLRTSVDGTQVSAPVLLHIRPKPAVAER